MVNVICGYCGRILLELAEALSEKAHVHKLEVSVVCDSPGGCGKTTTNIYSQSDFKAKKINYIPPPYKSDTFSIPEASISYTTIDNTCPNCGTQLDNGFCPPCEAIKRSA